MLKQKKAFDFTISGKMDDIKFRYVEGSGLEIHCWPSNEIFIPEKQLGKFFEAISELRCGVENVD
jgi:hypothetical protein